MGKYVVQGPDGKLHVIEGPDDASPADIEAAANSLPQLRAEPIVGTKAPVRKGGTGGGLSRDAVGSNGPQIGPDYSPTAGMSTGALMVTGAGKAMSDAALGIKGLFTDTSGDVADMRRRDAPLMDTGAGLAGNALTNVGIALAPGAALKGVSYLAGAAGAPAAADALGVAGGELMAPATIRGGIGMGAATGAIQPALNGSERIDNTLLGGAMGGAIPVAGRVVKTANSVLEPFYSGGQEAIVGRAINRAAGSDAPNALQRLEDASQPFVGPSQGIQRQTMGEIVPGSIPTTGQVSGNPGINALEQAASAVNPEVKNAITARLQQQNAARVGVLTDLAGNDGQREFFDANRKATANGLYGQAFTAPLDPQALATAQPTFDALSKNPYILDALPMAKKLAAGDGVSLDTGSVQGMHYLKLALDDAISKGANPQTSAGANTLRQMNSAQQQLVGGIEAISPDYAAARQTYADMSKPINQMDVGQALVDKSVGNLDGNLKPTAYANALSDQTAARATGFKGATLDNTLEPTQQNALESVLSDLKRANTAQTTGKGIGSNSVQNLAYANMLDQSGVPTFVRDFAPAQVVGNLGGRVADAAYGRSNTQLSNLLAQILSDPAEVARVMRKTGPYANNGNSLAEILRMGAQPSMLSLPRSIDAVQQ